MVAPETTHARQAALLLHSLPLPARRQVLARLDAAESRKLKPLLEELTALGVAQSLGKQLLDAASPPASTAPAPDERKLTLQEQVERLSAEAVVAGLQTCAPPTVAQLMRAGTWPWKSQVLDAMSGARRAQVLEYLRGDSAPLAPAALKLLCERLCRSAAEPSTNPQPISFKAHPRSSGFKRLISWMR